MATDGDLRERACTNGLVAVRDSLGCSRDAIVEQSDPAHGSP
jgi:hypothetical protein